MAKSINFYKLVEGYGDKIRGSKGAKKNKTYTNDQKDWEKTTEGKLVKSILENVTKLASVAKADLFKEGVNENPLFKESVLRELSADKLKKLEKTLVEIVKLSEKPESAKTEEAIKTYSDALKEIAPYVICGANVSAYGEKIYKQYVDSVTNGKTKGAEVVPGEISRMSEADVEVINAFKFMGIEVHYVSRGENKGWHYDKSATEANPNGFVVGNSQPYKLSETMVESFLNGYINKPESQRSFRINANGLFQSFLKVINGEYLPTLSKENKGLAQKALEQYKEKLSVNSREWANMQLASDITIRRQSSLYTTQQLILETCGDTELLLGDKFKFSDYINDSDEVSFSIIGDLDFLAVDSQAAVRESEVASLSGDKYLDKITDAIKGLLKSQAVFEKAKTTSSEEYKAIVKEVESLQQARLKYMQSTAFKHSYARHYVPETLIRTKDADVKESRVTEIVENGFANLGAKGSRICDSICTAVDKADCFDLSMENGEMTIQGDKIMGGNAKSRAKAKAIGENAVEYTRKKYGKTLEEVVEDIKADKEASADMKERDFVVQPVFKEFAKTHIPDILAYMEDSEFSDVPNMSRTFTQAMLDMSALDYYTYMFSANGPLDVGFNNYKNSHPNEKDPFMGFVNSIRGEMGKDIPDWIFKTAYNDTHPQTPLPLDPNTDIGQKGKLNSEFENYLVMMDRVAESFSEEEYAKFVDEKYSDDLRQKLVNEKLKTIKSQIADGSRPITDVDRNNASKRQKQCTLSRMMESDYTHLQQKIKNGEASAADETLHKYLHSYMASKKANQDKLNQGLNKTVDVANTEGCEAQAGTHEQKTTKKYGDMYPQPPDHQKYMKTMSKYNKKAVIKQFIVPLLKYIQSLKITKVSTVANDVNVKFKDIKKASTTPVSPAAPEGDVSFSKTATADVQEEKEELSEDEYVFDGVTVSRDDFEALAFEMGAQVLKEARAPEVIKEVKSDLAKNLSSNATEAIEQRKFLEQAEKTGSRALEERRQFFEFLANNTPHEKYPEEMALCKRDIREIMFGIVDGSIKNAQEKESRVQELATKYPQVLDSQKLEAIMKQIKGSSKESLTYLLSFSSGCKQPGGQGNGTMSINSKFTPQQLKHCGDMEKRSRIASSKIRELDDAYLDGPGIYYTNVARLVTEDMIRQRFKGNKAMEGLIGEDIHLRDVSYESEAEREY